MIALWAGALALSAAISLGGSADALVTRKLDRLTLKVPGVWKASTEDGTRRWEAPSKDAQFSLDVFAVEGKPLDPADCVEKLTRALGGEGWERFTTGGAPAARRSFSDTLEDGKTEVVTWSYVGCDGRTKWALTFVMGSKKKDRFQAVAEQVVQSLRYTPARGTP